MCQMCEEADLYMAQLQAAERKAADAKARDDGKANDKAGGRRDDARAAVRGK